MTRIGCCEPFYAAGTWRHGRECPRSANARLERDERTQLVINHRADQAARFLEGVIDDDPANVDQAVPRLATWYSHDVGCTCEPCAYVDAHLDHGR
jgi:hypothetical protein